MDTVSNELWFFFSWGRISHFTGWVCTLVPLWEVKVNLKLLGLLILPSKSWDQRWEAPCPVYAVLGIGLRVLSTLLEQLTIWALFPSPKYLFLSLLLNSLRISSYVLWSYSHPTPPRPAYTSPPPPIFIPFSFSNSTPVCAAVHIRMGVRPSTRCVVNLPEATACSKRAGSLASPEAIDCPQLLP